MSNRPILDPVEATFRDLRGAVYAADGHAARAAIERRPDLHTLQYVGDGLRLALVQGVTGAARRAGPHIAALRNRDLDGDEDLAIELEAAPGLAQARAPQDLAIELDELCLALDGDPLMTGGRVDLRTGEVHSRTAMVASLVVHRGAASCHIPPPRLLRLKSSTQHLDERDTVESSVRGGAGWDDDVGIGRSLRPSGRRSG